jgi:hypothetical protein
MFLSTLYVPFDEQDRNGPSAAADGPQNLQIKMIDSRLV